MTHRFFIPPAWLTPPTVTFSGEMAHQIKTVLRMQPGDEVIVLDNSGQAWRVVLTEIGKATVQGNLIAEQVAQGEPRLQITLYQGTLKGSKFEWVLQKGTELGISRFAPTICHRSVVSRRAALDQKRARWEKIIQEAAEQSGRDKLPRLEAALPLAEALVQAQGQALRLMPWEEAGGASLRSVLAEVQPETVAVFIGPEGGFTAEEAALAAAGGTRLVKLGPRILRAETAGLAVCAALLYELGEWG